MTHIKIGLTREQVEHLLTTMIIEGKSFPVKIDDQNVEAKVSLVNTTIVHDRIRKREANERHDPSGS